MRGELSLWTSYYHEFHCLKLLTSMALDLRVASLENHSSSSLAMANISEDKPTLTMHVPVHFCAGHSKHPPPPPPPPRGGVFGGSRQVRRSSPLQD